MMVGGRHRHHLHHHDHYHHLHRHSDYLLAKISITAIITTDDDDELMLNVLRCHLTY